MVKVFKATEDLPSLPQVLVRILDALQGGEADFQELAGVLLHDAAMSARIISVANSSFYSRGGSCHSVERALLSLGLDMVKTLVLTASIKQLFGQFNPGHRAYIKQVWRHTLITASLAQVLATLTRYPRPDEAYLCGLLVDVGQLALLSSEEQRYWPMLQATTGGPALVEAEREAFGQSHCDLAGEFMETWGLGSFMADAVRYHLEPVSRVQDAHHLVKLINLAHVLGRQEGLSDEAIAAADELFGLNEGLTRELRGRIAGDVSRLAGSLEIDIDTTDETDRDCAADRALGQRVSDLGQLSQLSGALGQVQGVEGKRTAVERALFMTLGVARSVLFLCDPQGQSVSAWVEDAQAPAFTLPLVEGRSLVSDVLIKRTDQLREANALESLPVVDRQLFTLCQAEVLWLLPLVHEDTSVGVLVLGLSRSQRDELTRRTPFIQALSREIASVLARDTSTTDATALMEQRIREMVHEAGNPLSIIQNYLGMLRIKLGEDHDAHRELGLIRDEIDRVGRILLRMRNDPQAGDGAFHGSLNELVRQVAEIFSGSLCRTRGIALHLDLSPADPPLQQPADHLRQVLTNLLKNATEALGEGGEIRVLSRDPVSVNGRQFTQLVVADNGPGLPDSVVSSLFSPVTSTKGAGHSGLGLSIVKKLVDEMGATIVCASGTEGTQFQILLPHSHHG